MQENLTRQEQKVFELLLTGAIPKDIAVKLSISYNTVLNHQRSIYRKLGIHSIKELLVKYKPTTRKTKSPLIFTFNENHPYPWQFLIYPDMYFYENEWQPSPFKLGSNNKINEGNVFYVTLHFTSDTDLNELFLLLQDFTVQSKEWRAYDISDYCSFGKVKSNTEYKIGGAFIATKTASSTAPNANLFAIYAHADTQPTISFTKLKIVKLTNK